MSSNPASNSLYIPAHGAHPHGAIQPMSHLPEEQPEVKKAVAPKKPLKKAKTAKTAKAKSAKAKPSKAKAAKTSKRKSIH